MGPWTGEAPCGPIRTKKSRKILCVSAPPARQHRPLIAPASDRASASARPVKFTLIFLARPCEQQRSRRRAAQRPEKYAVEFMPAPGDPEHGPYATHCPPDMKRRQAAHEHHRSKPRQHTTATRDKQTVKHGALPPQALSCVSVSAQVPTTPPRATKPARKPRLFAAYLRTEWSCGARTGGTKMRTYTKSDL